MTGGQQREKSLCAFKKGKQLSGNNFLGCFYKLFKLFSNDAKESSPDVIVDGVVVLRKTKGHNTVLMAQAPPRGASAHARYLAVSRISERQDGRTILRNRLVFAVSPRSALSHSNLATGFRGKFRNEFLRSVRLNYDIM